MISTPPKAFTETYIFLIKNQNNSRPGGSPASAGGEQLLLKPLSSSAQGRAFRHLAGCLASEVCSARSHPVRSQAPARAAPHASPRSRPSPARLSSVPSEPSSPVHRSPGGPGTLHLPSPECTAMQWQVSSPLYFMPWLQKLLFPLLITFLLPICLFLISALFLH